MMQISQRCGEVMTSVLHSPAEFWPGNRLLVAARFGRSPGGLFRNIVGGCTFGTHSGTYGPRSPVLFVKSRRG